MGAIESTYTSNTAFLVFNTPPIQTHTVIHHLPVSTLRGCGKHALAASSRHTASSSPFAFPLSPTNAAAAAVAAAAAEEEEGTACKQEIPPAQGIGGVRVIPRLLLLLLLLLLLVGAGGTKAALACCTTKGKGNGPPAGAREESEGRTKRQCRASSPSANR